MATAEDMAMAREPMRDEDRLGSPMTTRWTAAELAFVVEEAWRRRQSASSLVRELVMAALRPEANAANATEA